jgi:hypothetical protein
VSTLHATARLRQAHRPGPEPLRVLSASGQLGYGIPVASFERGMARQPHVVGADMGSIDPGPFYLATGEMAAPAAMVRRDLRLVLEASLKAGIPLIIGSAGTAGAGPQLERVAALLREIGAELGLPFRLATIASDIPAQVVVDALAQGRLSPIGPMPTPSVEDVQACGHIVGQCGLETVQRALETDPDVVLAGRACDTAIFAALPALLGYPLGLTLHMAKIIECTSLCCEPGGRDAMLAELDAEGFTLESMDPERRATPNSVAAHALYEQADPHTVDEPGGTLHLDTARYSALDARRTRVSGALFVPRPSPTLKIEGARVLGARAVLLAGIADPGLIASIDSVLAAVTGKVRALWPSPWQMVPHVYGRGAVRALPPAQQAAHEVGLVLEFLAPDAEQARTVAGIYKQNLLHHGYPGRVATAGNLAFAFTPSELDAEQACQFVLYHIMHSAPVDALFSVAVHDVTASPDQALP